jgi:hypothetical protein
MNKRLANLPQNYLITSLRGIQTALNAFKQSQRISGRSGVLSYLTENEAPWDATATVGSNTDTDPVITDFTVTWVGDGSQDIAFANVSFSCFTNGTDSAHELTPNNPTWTDGTRTASITYLGTTRISHHTYEVQFSLSTLKEVTYYVKSFTQGSCPGILTVTT